MEIDPELAHLGYRPGRNRRRQPRPPCPPPRSGDYPGVGQKCHSGPCGPTFGHEIGLCEVRNADSFQKPLWMLFPAFWGWITLHRQKRLDERKGIAPSLAAQIDRNCASHSHVEQP